MTHRYRPHPRSRLFVNTSLLGMIAIMLLAAAACNRPTRPEAQQSTAPPTSVPAPAVPSQPLPPTLAALADQGKALRFDHLTPEAGLSQSVVLDFVQDDQGFLWMATQDGLNRYDGYEFKIFKDDPESAQQPEGQFRRLHRQGAHRRDLDRHQRRRAEPLRSPHRPVYSLPEQPRRSQQPERELGLVRGRRQPGHRLGRHQQHRAQPSGPANRPGHPLSQRSW